MEMEGGLQRPTKERFLALLGETLETRVGNVLHECGR